MPDVARVCATCGGSLSPDDRFCGDCGAAVSAPPPTPPPGTLRRRLVIAAVGVGAAILVAALITVVVLSARGRPGDSEGAAAPESLPASATATAEPSPAPTPTPTPTPTAEPGFAGQWAGEILGDSHPYTVQVTMVESDGVVSGTAVYPEIPCQGSWAQSSRVGSTAIVIETMPPTNVCYDQVAITLILAPDGTMSYTAQSGPYLITSTLVRTG